MTSRRRQREILAKFAPPGPSNPPPVPATRKKFPRINFFLQVLAWIGATACVITTRSASARIEVGIAIGVTVVFWLRRLNRGR